MKYLIAILLFSSSAFGMNRYNIKNDFTGNTFLYESDSFDHWEPAYGLKAREIPCVDVPPNEVSRITKREMREVEPAVYAPIHIDEPVPQEPVLEKPAVVVEFCSLPNQFTVKVVDLTPEIAEKTRKETVRSARALRLIALAKKVKAKTITTAERNELVELMVMEIVRQMDDTVD
jgi:hypothetical protein